MSKICQLSGKKAIVGHKVSFSNKKTLRKFNPNLFKKKFYLVEEDRFVTLKVAASTLRTINKKGFDAVYKEAKAKGFV